MEEELCKCNLDRVSTVSLGHDTKEIQRHIQRLGSELCKLPRPPIVTIRIANPDTALVTEHVLCQVTGGREITGVLCRGGGATCHVTPM